MMKHYRMTATEVISWMRICRPGCVIGPQQQFLQDLEPIMWQEGDMMRIEKGICLPVEETGTKKKRITTPQSSRLKMDYPETQAVVTPDATSGRPGQAEGLLASRRQRLMAASSNSKGKGAAAPVPITPDSVSGKAAPRFSTKTPGGSRAES